MSERSMTNSDLEDLFNLLYDLSLASRDRLASASALADLPEVKGHLALRAAEHDLECDRLIELVREVRGTPHDGSSDALLRDPLLGRPIGSRRNDRELLANCCAEEELITERLADALRRDGLPAHAREVLGDCKAAAETRHRSFESLLAKIS